MTRAMQEPPVLRSHTTEDLDPRRRRRGLRTRDFRSMSRTVAVPRVHELLATALVRLGIVR
ncbi:MAG: hypothetical protein JWM98_1170 [Thermoleophilia bacterium]|nr:hypothetical protein [Thermoleophilia bacterium]